MPGPSFESNAERFEVRRKLGTSSMATLYEAWDRKLERTVALKFLNLEEPVIDQDDYDQILLEARAAARLDHPNIASVYDVMTLDGKACLIMQYIDGTSLSALRGCAPLPFEELRRIAVAIARGLAEAHRNGVIHRDIKPSNIMLARTGEVKIVDFGLARIVTERSVRTLTTSHVSGTPTYMSPEVLESIRPDASADIFSAGIVYYELCTGRYPFRATNFRVLFDDIVHAELPPLKSVNRKIPRWFSRVVQRMTAKNRRERYRDGVELLEALESRLPRLVGPHAPPGPAPPDEDRATVIARVLTGPRRFGAPRAGIQAPTWFSAAVAAVRAWLGR